MCTLIALYEFVPGTNPYWVWYDCQTALRVTVDTPALAFRSLLNRVTPCPVHNPEEWTAGGYLVDRVGIIADISQDKP